MDVISFKTRIHVNLPSLVFSHSIIFQWWSERFKMYSCIWCSFESLDFFLFSYLSTRPFYHGIPVPIFYTKTFVSFANRLLVCPCSFFHDLWLEFSFFIFKYPVLFVLLDSVSASLMSLYSHQYLLIYIFKLHWVIYLLLCFVFFSPNISLCVLSPLASSLVVAIYLRVLQA